MLADLPHRRASLAYRPPMRTTLHVRVTRAGA